MPVVRGIPRFVPAESYADSFGLQWNTFSTEQLDSEGDHNYSKERLLSETGWDADWFRDRLILDAGCGAGRFLEVAVSLQSRVVGVDLSNAVDAASPTLDDWSRQALVQGSLLDLPFQDQAFDGVYCIGVLQHTPDPSRCIAELVRVLAPGGRLAITAYERRRFTMLNGKYLARRFTTKLPEGVLLGLLRLLMPALFLISEALFRAPVLGRVFRFALPVANYVEKDRLSLRERYRWALLDTFDMLSPAYDQPLEEAATVAQLAALGMQDIKRLPSDGLTLVATKSP